MPNKPETETRQQRFVFTESLQCQVLDRSASGTCSTGSGVVPVQNLRTMNMAFPPLTWQRIDIHFRAARYGGAAPTVRIAERAE